LWEGSRAPALKERPLLPVNKVSLQIDLDENGDRIFGMDQTFHQHEDSRGVGLYMTKTQVESMGGEIAVKSEEKKGTTFTATF